MKQTVPWILCWLYDYDDVKNAHRKPLTFFVGAVLGVLEGDKLGLGVGCEINDEKKKESEFVEIANGSLGILLTRGVKREHKQIFISPDLFLLTSFDGDLVGFTLEHSSSPNFDIASKPWQSLLSSPSSQHSTVLDNPSGSTTVTLVTRGELLGAEEGRLLSEGS